MFCPCAAYRHRSANIGSSGAYPVYEDPDTFYTALNDFLDDSSNARFESEIIFDDDGLIKVFPVYPCVLCVCICMVFLGPVRQFILADAQKGEAQRTPVMLAVVSIDLPSTLVGCIFHCRCSELFVASLLPCA